MKTANLTYRTMANIFDTGGGILTVARVEATYLLKPPEIYWVKRYGTNDKRGEWSQVNLEDVLSFIHDAEEELRPDGGVVSIYIEEELLDMLLSTLFTS